MMRPVRAMVMFVTWPVLVLLVASVFVSVVMLTRLVKGYEFYLSISALFFMLFSIIKNKNIIKNIDEWILKKIKIISFIILFFVMIPYFRSDIVSAVFCMILFVVSFATLNSKSEIKPVGL